MIAERDAMRKRIAELEAENEEYSVNFEDMFECDVEGHKKYGKMLADLRGETPRPPISELLRRIAELEEALDMLAIATRKYRSLPRIDGDTIGRLEAELSEALEKARAALEGDAPKEGHPIAREQREADEYRRRLQKEFEASNKDCPDCGNRDCDEITCPCWREEMAGDPGAR